jgi:hypothetical protein
MSTGEYGDLGSGGNGEKQGISMSGDSTYSGSGSGDGSNYFATRSQYIVEAVTTAAVDTRNATQQPVADADALVACVRNNDVAALRAYADQAFWSKQAVPASWAHLRTAIDNKNLDIARLLVLWGARATAENLKSLRAEDDENYADSLRLLRRAGHPLRAKDLAEAEAAEKERAAARTREAELEKLQCEEKEKAAQAEKAAEEAFDESLLKNADKIPTRWLDLLTCIHEEGAPGAIIAGGALRDTFNERAVKDVDIFLPTRGSARKNEKFIRRVFAQANMQIMAQDPPSFDYFSRRTEYDGDPVRAKKRDIEMRGHYGMMALKAESWEVKAYSVPNDVIDQYNIVFVSGHAAQFLEATFNARAYPLSDILTRDLKKEKEALVLQYMENFDFGICRVATDGQNVFMSPEYKKDVKDKTITLCLANDSSTDHLFRIVAKYPDWKPCNRSRERLNPPVGAWRRGGVTKI